MKRNNLIYTGLVSCLLMATTACSDYLDINQNPEYPTEASSSTLLPSGIAGVASIVGGTYELYGSMWSQQCTQGHTSNQYNTLVNYTITNASDSAGFANSQSLTDKLIERKDPRLERVMLSPTTADKKRVQVTGSADKNLVPAPNGTPEQNMQKYGVSAFVYSNTAPTMLMSYHELKFLQAEALCRLNRTSDAEKALKEAVAAGIANAERSVSSAITYMGSKMVVNSEKMTEETANTYFDNQVKPLFAVNPLKETMIQKYLALWGASGEATETFNDIRRMKGLGENFVTLANTKKFPLRMPYGNSDVVSNPEVKAAYGDGQYVYSEPVWWAGGTR